jgi:hypothetical protein
MMSTVQELHHMLSMLIDVWPEDHPHPTVEQARAYLQSGHLALDNDELPGEHQMIYMEIPSSADSYQDATWYSI